MHMPCITGNFSACNSMPYFAFIHEHTEYFFLCVWWGVGGVGVGWGGGVFDFSPLKMVAKTDQAG